MGRVIWFGSLHFVQFVKHTVVLNRFIVNMDNFPMEYILTCIGKVLTEFKLLLTFILMKYS